MGRAMLQVLPEELQSDDVHTPLSLGILLPLYRQAWLSQRFHVVAYIPWTLLEGPPWTLADGVCIPDGLEESLVGLL